MSRLSIKTKNLPPTNALRLFLYNILDSASYELFINLVIILNTFWMATEHDPEETLYIDLSFYVGWVFIVIYVGETGAKIIAYGVLDIQFREETEEDAKKNSDTENRPSLINTIKDKWSRCAFEAPTSAIRGTASTSQ